MDKMKRLQKNAMDLNYLPYKTFRRRFTAKLIDYNLLTIFSIFNLIVVNIVTNGIIYSVLHLLINVGFYFYCVVGDYKYGTTLGKYLTGIYVKSSFDQERNISFQNALFRETPYLLMLLSTSIGLYANLLLYSDSGFQKVLNGKYITDQYFFIIVAFNLLMLIDSIKCIISTKRISFHDQLSQSIVIIKKNPQYLLSILLVLTLFALLFIQLKLMGSFKLKMLVNT